MIPIECLINRKAPTSPHTTRAGGADQDGHLGRVKARGGGRRAEEGRGAGHHFNINHREHRGTQRMVKTLCALCVLCGLKYHIDFIFQQP